MKKLSGSMAGVSVLLVAIILVGFVAGCSREEASAPQKVQAPVATAPQPAATPPVAQPQAPAATSTQTQPLTPVPETQPATPGTPPATPPAVAAPQNPAQVQVGMTSQEVLRIMGNPTRVKQEGQFIEWEYYTAQGKFEVKLQGDKVAYIKRH